MTPTAPFTVLAEFGEALGPGAPVHDFHIAFPGVDPARENHVATLCALADGALGVRGVIEERGADSAGTSFIAAIYETSPIHYHERLQGFAATTDTRVPVADGTRISIRIEDEDGDLSAGEILQSTRTLDLARGALVRRTRWRSPGGRIVDIHAERVVTQGADPLLAIRLSVTPVDFTGRIILRSALRADTGATEQGNDPRIGATTIGGGIEVERIVADRVPVALVQRTRQSGKRVVSAQAHRIGAPISELAGESDICGVDDLFAADLGVGETATIEKFVTYAWDGEDPLARARMAADDAAGSGFDTLAAARADGLADFWRMADIAVDDDPAITRALRFNLFHLHQSANIDGATGLSAKGLTGEGYEGHCFWDAEAFALPALALTDPARARGHLVWRYRTLDAARAHARSLDHPVGALFPWRTISGAEGSAHYPSGSAQYHINADIAFAIGLYVRASGDEDFLRQMGAEMLFETARIWLDIGHFDARRNGAFCIAGVTGPDEYTALIDNNWFTNRMAQRHLRAAVDADAWLAQRDPAGHDALAARIGLGRDEIAAWARAADAIYLPYDDALGIDAQDDSFLSKPRWDDRGDARRPLLLHHHPMTLYRHQVAKQADLVLALVLAGADIDAARKQRDYDYYEAVTIHDSTLSANSFSILASEVGRPEAAMAHFRATTLVDLENLHGNSDHGVHIAAMAGSWLALVWGFGGLRCDGAAPAFAPVLPAEWAGYRFTFTWRGSTVSVSVTGEGACYSLIAGEALLFLHNGVETLVQPGAMVRLPLREAAI